ncbi:hypothetical protein Ahy_B01g056386 [Arachis hypogaea]|uniref:Replication factor A C-terminal domain-containing protein n=1 Tax=Arachis hypogaea TaxID=3818 RepID=A0A445AYW2_ARAHY|nr:hypothetical protein Ahy_B01g056386 [Arachis hypogaea]
MYHPSCLRKSESEHKKNELYLGDDRIHGSIPKCVVARWRDNIFEFQMYLMRNFIVTGNKFKPRTTNSNWVLIFFQQTMVTHVNIPSYPLEAFCFKSISNLLNAERLDDTYLFRKPKDLITSKDKKTKRLEQQDWVYFVWGDGGSIQPHLEKESVESFIVVLQYFKASQPLSGAPLNSIKISQVSTQRAWSAADELKQGSVGMKTIEEVLNAVEIAACWIAATIISINAGKNDWLYKRVKLIKYELDDRYKIEVIVYDGTSSMTLLLWNREAIQLCRKKADQIKEKKLKCVPNIFI